MRLSAHRRPAFTLLEVMVMISIIAILATLSTAAVMRVQSSQREGNTSKDLQKIQMGLDQQHKAALDLIRKEQPHDIIKLFTSKSDCSPDPSRAMALHTMLRLRQEFPQNFAEAQFQFPNAQIPNPCNPTQTINLGSLNAMYGPKLVYTNAIGSANTTDQALQAAVLLPIVMAQNRGGAQFDIMGVGTAGQVDAGGGLMKSVLMDAWGYPICLRRWATDQETLARNELNQEPNVSKQAIISGFKNPIDPEGRLTAGKWNNGITNPYNTRQVAMTWFTKPLPAVAAPFDDPTLAAGANGNLNRGPFVLSAGKDKTYVTEDDIYSFRIQNLGKGN